MRKRERERERERKTKRDRETERDRGRGSETESLKERQSSNLFNWLYQCHNEEWPHKVFWPIILHSFKGVKI